MLSQSMCQNQCFSSKHVIMCQNQCFPSQHAIMGQNQCFPSKHAIMCQNQCFPSQHTIMGQKQCFPSKHAIICQNQCFPSQHAIMGQNQCFPTKHAIMGQNPQGSGPLWHVYWETITGSVWVVGVWTDAISRCRAPGYYHQAAKQLSNWDKIPCSRLTSIPGIQTGLEN